MEQHLERLRLDLDRASVPAQLEAPLVELVFSEAEDHDRLRRAAAPR
jgi:hypothetical protein